MTKEKKADTFFSLGQGNRSIQKVIDILKFYSIQFLIDVRSNPTSRIDKDFDQSTFSKKLRADAIKYVYMGDSLGGRPSNREFYDQNGYVDYLKIRKSNKFLNAIDRLKIANKKRISIAIFCSEAKPEECHRCKLIGEHLHSLKINIIHIDENDIATNHQDVIKRITEDSNFNLFEDKHLIINKSRKSYHLK